MSEQSSDNNHDFKSMTGDVRRYVEKRLELITITISEQLTYLMAESIQRIIGILLLSGGLMFLWFALSFYTGGLVGSVALGFLICSLPLLLVGGLFVKFKPKWVTKTIQSGMLMEILDSFEHMEPESGKSGDLSDSDDRGSVDGKKPGKEGKSILG